jgi:hypothetical protein
MVDRYAKFGTEHLARRCFAEGWSLELTGLPRICLDALAIVPFLGWETKNIHWHDEECLGRAKAAYDELCRMFTHLSAVYANQGS